LIKREVARFLQGNQRSWGKILPARIRGLIRTGLYQALVPNPITFQGIKLWRHPVRAESDRILIQMPFGTYEPETTKLLLSLLQPGMHFVDVGAHIGYYTLLAARAVGSVGKVWAFEPTPPTFLLLRQNILENNAQEVVEAVQKAVTDKVGCSMFFLHPMLSRSSIVEPRDMKAHCAARVETTSLDAFFKERGWPRVDIVKMDVEGAETMVIQGMRELVHRNPRLRLIVEFSPANMRAAGVTAEDFLSSLHSLGFSGFVIDDRVEKLHFPSETSALADYVRRGPVNLLCER